MNEETSFEKARFDYSVKVFESENSRTQSLETKSQFYLTLVLAFLTAIFFSLPYITMLQSLMHNVTVGQVGKLIITLLLIILGVALLCSLLAVLLAMKVRKYKAEYPNQTYKLLFTDPLFEENNEAMFHSFLSRFLIEMLQDNKNSNDKKAKYVEVASYTLLFATVILCLLVGTVIYLQTYVIPPLPGH